MRAPPRCATAPPYHRGMWIDLNADVGEAFGPWPMGEDEALIPLVSSVNVACGAHAGDPVTMRRTVALAGASGAAIGAHPGYPDLAGFGRRELAMSPDEIEASILVQVGGLAAIAAAAGLSLRHLKAHGALYNRAVHDAAAARAIARATRAVGPDLVLVGLAGSELLRAGLDVGLAIAAEAFPDRAYEPDGSLRSRRHDDALVDAPADVAARAVRMARDGLVEAVDGTLVELRPDTLCIHGDRPGAAARARAVRQALADAGIEVRRLGG